MLLFSHKGVDFMSDISKGVAREIDFANLVGMEVKYLENTEQY